MSPYDDNWPGATLEALAVEIQLNDPRTIPIKQIRPIAPIHLRENLTVRRSPFTRR